MGGAFDEDFGLEPEPEAEVEGLVVEASEEEVPPDPVFLIQKDAYGKGTERVTLTDGTPVGLWLEEYHHNASGEQVRELLLRMGLDETRAAWFAGHRTKAIEARAEIAASPPMQSLAVAEAQAEDRVSLVRQAFLKRQAEGKGKL